jgi:hypothetical protein
MGLFQNHPPVSCYQNKTLPANKCPALKQNKTLSILASRTIAPHYSQKALKVAIIAGHCFKRPAPAAEEIRKGHETYNSAEMIEIKIR